MTGSGKLPRGNVQVTYKDIRSAFPPALLGPRLVDHIGRREYLASGEGHPGSWDLTNKDCVAVQDDVNNEGARSYNIRQGNTGKRHNRASMADNK